MRIDTPYIAGVKFNQLKSAKGSEGGKTGCENTQRHIFHHLSTHSVIRVNFGMVSASDNGSAPLRLCKFMER